MRRAKNKIVIVIPYFGKWPPWFEYFLYSCGYNSLVNWLFFTDCDTPSVSYENIRFIDFTMDDFNRLASNKLDLRIEILHPYKICDLRPAFGDIFTDYIKDYDFWGYGDIDLIYGNLNAYFIDELLSNHDLLSNHGQFISGHLCVLRNSPKTVFLYRKDGIYKKIFKDPFYTGFDEQLLKRKMNPDGEHLQLRMRSHLRRHIFKVSLYSFLSGMIPLRLKSRLRKQKNPAVKDFTSIVKHYAESEGIRVLHLRTFQSDLMLKKMGVKNWSITWDKGRLTSSYNREGILYFHFIMSKLDNSFSIQDFISETDRFTITKSGITIGSG